MNTTSTSAKRSNYPFSAVLILIVHLALGYMIYQKVVAKPAGTNATELKAISSQPEKPAIP